MKPFRFLVCGTLALALSGCLLGVTYRDTVARVYLRPPNAASARTLPLAMADFFARFQYSAVRSTGGSPLDIPLATYQAQRVSDEDARADPWLQARPQSIEVHFLPGSGEVGFLCYHVPAVPSGAENLVVAQLVAELTARFKGGRVRSNQTAGGLRLVTVGD